MNHPVNEHDEVMGHVRESFSGLRMNTPVEKVLAASRARQRRRLSGLTVAVAGTAGATAAVTLALAGPAPTPVGPAPARTSSPAHAGSGPVRLAAFSVTSGPGDRTTLVLHKGPKYPRLNPGALRAALARHGIPALVTVGTFCRSVPGAPGIGQVVHASDQADGSAMVIDGRAMPTGTRLSIGYFGGHVRMGLIEDGAHLSCGSAFRQPAVHITPTGTPIRK